MYADSTLGVKKENAPPKPADKKYDRSLTKALHATFWKRWWLTGLARLVADTLKTTSPLVNKALLTWLTEVYIYYRIPEEARSLFPVSRRSLRFLRSSIHILQGGAPRGIGYGIGLVFALFAMQEVSSLVRCF
jgi:ATP-binding cassette subfamily C (CFTR/MRP) protein 1